MKYLLLFLSFNSFAFYLNTNIGASFSNHTVKFYVTSNSTCTNAGVTPSELLSIAEEGAKKFWNRVPSSSLELKSGGFYETSEANFLTGILCVEQSACTDPSDIPAVKNIIIACNSNTTENFPSSQLYALSAPNNLSNSNIAGSVILINDSASTPFSGLSRAEMVNVLAHEMGHAIGIGHSEDRAALMYFQNLPHRNKLGQDDIDAVTYLYPNKLDGCGSFFGTLGSDNDSSGGLAFFLTALLGIISMTCIIRPIFITFRYLRNRHSGTSELYITHEKATV